MFDMQFFLDHFWDILQSVPVTLAIAVVSILSASLIGLLVAWIRIKKSPFLNTVAIVFISFSRSIPNLVMLYFMYYAFPYVIGFLKGDYSIVAGANKLSPYTAAIVTFTITFSGYFAEVFRSAYYSVDKGQHEAALSIGLSPFTYFRRILIPQATINALPNYTSTAIDLIKDSALVYTISIIDIMGKANMVAAKGFHYIEAYFIALILYLIICFSLAKSFRYIENKINHYV